MNHYRKNIFFRSPKNFFEKPCSLYERNPCTHLSYDGVLSGIIIRITFRAAKNNSVDTSQRCRRTTIATVSSAHIETKQLLGCVDFTPLRSTDIVYQWYAFDIFFVERVGEKYNLFYIWLMRALHEGGKVNSKSPSLLYVISNNNDENCVHKTSKIVKIKKIKEI